MYEGVSQPWLKYPWSQTVSDHGCCMFLAFWGGQIGKVVRSAARTSACKEERSWCSPA